MSQTSDSEYAVHLYWDHKEPEVSEGWVPNVSAKSLKLADLTSDIKYGWISQIRSKLALTKTAQTK